MIQSQNEPSLLQRRVIVDHESIRVVALTIRDAGDIGIRVSNERSDAFVEANLDTGVFDGQSQSRFGNSVQEPHLDHDLRVHLGPKDFGVLLFSIGHVIDVKSCNLVDETVVCSQMLVTISKVRRAATYNCRQCQAFAF